MSATVTTNFPVFVEAHHPENHSPVGWSGGSAWNRLVYLYHYPFGSAVFETATHRMAFVGGNFFVPVGSGVGRPLADHVLSFGKI